MALVIERYLQENIDSHIQIQAWNDLQAFPIFLISQYDFYAMNVLGTQCLLLEIIGEAPALSGIQKHRQRIQAITHLQVVLYYKAITRYRRKSLLEQRIPFIIEDGQIFLPFIGLQLAKVVEQTKKKIQTFTPSAQIAYLYFLYNKDAVVHATEFSNIVGGSVMTASRALNALYDAKLLTYETGGKTGRTKEYRRISDSEYFTLGRDLLGSPIKKVVYVRNVPDNSFVAGLEALAALSRLNPPRYKVRAMCEENLHDSDIEIVTNAEIIQDEKLVELQIWGYDPKPFTNNLIVDPVSLYASLQEEQDERIEQAFEEVLEAEKWYTD